MVTSKSLNHISLSARTTQDLPDALKYFAQTVNCFMYDFNSEGKHAN